MIIYTIQKTNFTLTTYILKQTFLEIPEVIWTQVFSLLKNSESGMPPKLIHMRSEMLAKAIKYRVRAALEGGRGVGDIPQDVVGHHRFGKMILLQERYRYYKRRYGSFFTFIAVVLLHLWLLNFSLDVRKINLWEAVTTLHKNDFDPLLIFNLAALIVMTIFSFKFRATQPGYV